MKIDLENFIARVDRTRTDFVHLTGADPEFLYLGSAERVALQQLLTRTSLYYYGYDHRQQLVDGDVTLLGLKVIRVKEPSHLRVS